MKFAKTVLIVLLTTIVVLAMGAIGLYLWTHSTQAKARYDSISKDSREPQYVLSAFNAATQEAQELADASQAILVLVQDNQLVDYQLFEQVSMALEMTNNNLAGAKARQAALTADSRIPSDANDAANTAVADAQKAHDDWQAAYAAVQNDPLGKRLNAGWDEVKRTQDGLNNFVQASASSGGGSIESALAQIDAAAAARDQASVRLAEVKAGARQEQIDAAQAQVAIAQAQVKVQEIQLGKYSLASPLHGVILSRGTEPGETVTPGATLFEIGDLEHLRITVYLPEEMFGTVKAGDQASVKLDAYPNRTFTARIDRLADQAEFTPSNVQTVQGRRNTVFAVYLSLTNSDLALKPGMWADVTFSLSQ